MIVMDSDPATRPVTTWDGARPRPGESDRIKCPRCGGDAVADRVGNRIYGCHDKPGECGWVAARTAKAA